MRSPPPLLLAALALTACSGDRRTTPAERGAAPATARGPDPVLLRVARSGGRLTATVYPRLDSVVWRSTDAVPALGRVLAFDADGGQLAALDTGGRPTRIDLRLGTVRSAAKAALDGAVANGTTFYGVGSDGAVTRLTTSGGDWRVRLGQPVQELYPQRDGSVLAVAARGGTGTVWVLRPPAAHATDSATVPGGARALRTGAADRVYFAAGEELVGVRTRDLEPVAPVSLGAPVQSAAATPSGDRLYVTTARAGEVQVVDGYADGVADTVTLPGAVRALRVDPLGRYVLARPARGDSAWVIAVGTDRVVGTVAGAWREDLPLVLPDGAIASATGDDVTILDGATLRPRGTVAGGAADFWHLVLWNGFRPRAAELDQPVTFDGGERAPEAADTAAGDSAATPPDSSAPPTDSVTPTPAESTITRGVPRPTVPPPTAAAPTRPAPATVAAAATASAGEVAFVRTQDTGEPTPPPRTRERAQPHATRRVRPGRGYTLQFAAVPSEREARRYVARLAIGEPAARVVPATRGGRTVYRVVAGPFASRRAAERVGRAAGGDYWVYEGAP